MFIKQTCGSELLVKWFSEIVLADAYRIDDSYLLCHDLIRRALVHKLSLLPAVPEAVVSPKEAVIVSAWNKLVEADKKDNFYSDTIYVNFQDFRSVMLVGVLVDVDATT